MIWILFAPRIHKSEQEYLNKESAAGVSQQTTGCGKQTGVGRSWRFVKGERQDYAEFLYSWLTTHIFDWLIPVIGLPKKQFYRLPG